MPFLQRPSSLSLFSATLVALMIAPDILAAPPASVALVLSPSLTSVRNESNLAQEQGIDSDRKLGWGGGILFDAPVADALSFGIGALYIQRKFQIGTGSVRFERSVPTVFVPVEVKAWMGNVLSLGVGGFGAIRVGDTKNELVSGAGTLTATSNSSESFQYGLTASANVLFPVAERTGLVFGARYLYGLNDGDKGVAYDEKIDDLALTAGISFSLSGSESSVQN